MPKDRAAWAAFRKKKRRAAGERAAQVDSGSNAIKVFAAYGRLYVSGPGAGRLSRLPGAAYNENRDAYELSLTLETMGRIKRAMGFTSRQLARYCTEDVMQWARAAAASEKAVNALHERLGNGWRLDLPWADLTGHPQTGEYRAPFEHQQVMATAAACVDGLAFLAQMGTGKTRAALEAAGHKLRENEVDLILVVCPKRVIGSWVRQAREFSEDLRPVRLEGELAKRKTLMREAERGHLLIVNYDVLHKLQPAIEQLADRLKLGLVFDEAHKLKNPQAKRSKAATNLARLAPWRLCLTGTPILQGIQDVWAQWYVVDLGVTFGANFVQYRREFLSENPYTHEIKAKGGALETVGLRMRKRGLRFRKEDCMDLPPKVWEVETVDMTSEQARAYRQMRDELVTRLRDDSEATSATQLTTILRLSQITSGFIPIDESDELHRFTPNPKIAALKEIVDDNIEDQQIIVWARYREDYRAIIEGLSEYEPVEITGRVSQAQGEEAERLFQSGQRRLLVGNAQAAGVGIDLFAGSLVVYFSQDYSLENREQSEDRSHRSGSEQHERVTYIDLVCEGTVDEAVRDALARKLSVAETVVELRDHLGV